MRLFQKFQNEDTAHVTVQLSASEYQSLRQWMHTPQGELVTFVHGVRLAKRGFGWFRLETSKTFRSVDKLKVSLAIVNKWHRDFEARRNQELRLLMAKAVGGALVTHYSTVNHAFTVKDGNRTTTVGLYKDTVVIPAEAAPSASTKPNVDPNRLFALTQKFGQRAQR